MSRHVPRRERWTQVNAKEYRAAFGVVRYQAGAWEGMVLYELRSEGATEGPEPGWQPQRAPAGRFKRPRNAMMAVEDKAREIRRIHKDHVRIAFEG